MSADREPAGRAVAPSSPDVQAAEHLRFIRDTMARAHAFTAVPGWGMVAMGVTAIAAAVVASRQPTQEAWLLVWIVEAVLAVGIGIFAFRRKVHRGDMTLRSGPGRKYLLSLIPPMLAGALITFGFWLDGDLTLLPGIWLLLYGAGTITGGAFSVRPVPMMGVAFMLLGVPTLFWPGVWADLGMSLGFGGAHIAFGAYIAKNHGG